MDDKLSLVFFIVIAFGFLVYCYKIRESFKDSVPIGIEDVEGTIVDVNKTNQDMCKFAGDGVYISKSTIEEIVTKFEETDLQNVNEIFKSNGLMTNNSDGSVDYHDGWLKDITFENINKLSCKLLRLYIIEKTSSSQESISVDDDVVDDDVEDNEQQLVTGIKNAVLRAAERARN